MGRSRYTIVRKLATGGMAEIFLATQHGAEGFQRPVVLKRILADLSADPQFRNALIDEAHVAMGLTHSNIAQVLDLGTNRGRYFLAMELVDGWDLNRLLRRGMATDLELPTNLALHVVTEVCRALAFAHSRTLQGKPLGIVHRDISPHNILVSEQGEVKLTDFGIAKALIKRDKTATGVVKGKISYMAPEQAFGSPLDARADLFSLGVTLYVATTGIRPFDGDSEIETLLRVRDCRYVPPGKARSGMPAPLCKLIERAMRKEPKDRFQTAEEMLLEAERVLRTLPPSGPTELKRWLAAVGAKDGKVPPSRLSAAPPEPDAQPDSDETEGLSVELDEAEDPARSLPQGPPPPAPAPAAGATASKSLSLAIDVVEDPSPAPSRLGRRLFLLFLLGLVAAGGYYAWTVKLVSEQLAALGGRPSSAPIVPAAAPTAVPDSGGATETWAIPPPPALPVPAEPDAAEPGTDAAAALDASEPAGADAGEGEADGGAAAEPDVELEPDAGPVALAPKAGAPRPAAAAKPAKDMVSLRVTSEPAGAAIRVEKTTFGVTPMRLRFRAGITYEINFSKAGYQPTQKLVTVTARQDQAVSATLKKEPAQPRRSPKK
ncbi:MAG TPA: serine/threonine-protein kinase [Myxococcales bacterium]